MDYPYKEVSAKYFRPIIPIYLHNNGNMLGYEALVDSGADFNIFHADVGRELGVDIKSGPKQPFAGINGPDSIGYVHKVQLEVAGENIKVPVIFSDDISPWGYGVLGQLGFFSEFTVKFTFSNLKVRVSKKI